MCIYKIVCIIVGTADHFFLNLLLTRKKRSNIYLIIKVPPPTVISVCLLFLLGLEEIVPRGKRLHPNKREAFSTIICLFSVEIFRQLFFFFFGFCTSQ